VVRQWRPYGAGGVSATPTRARPARRQRPMSARHMHRLAIRTAIRAATLVGAAAAALCVQLDGRGKMMRSRLVPPRTRLGEVEVAERAMLTA